MNEEVEASIRKNVAWSKLPDNVKQQLGQSAKEYDKAIVTFSVKNQLRYRGNLVRHVRKDEKKYYVDVITYSRQNLMLFPYHLSDVIIKGLFITPFQYYSAMLEMLMGQEKSYDSLPNFTAADCLRLLGIGRNQYIDLMNQSRSTKKFGFFRKSGKDLLPSQPVPKVPILPWWTIQVGYVTEDDMKSVDKAEHSLIDQLIDQGPCPAGHMDFPVVASLYRKGLIYFDVPIEDNDYVIVPPLEGFVMNRVLGDYFETLLYKIFVSIDENTTVAELANVLEIDGNLVRDAVSLYCRLGFAKKKNSELDSNDLHPSWYEDLNNPSKSHRVQISSAPSISSEDEDDSLLRELNKALESEDGDEGDFVKPSKEEVKENVRDITSPEVPLEKSTKKIGFFFDSTLTAYLMMGNLSPGLKNHAVTMFEVGKLSDESLDSLVTELEKVSDNDGEGEAARYFSHAITLRDTVLFFRNNAKLKSDDDNNMCLGLDLIRCESLQSLDKSTAGRLLKKNYSLLVSMAPLSNEIRPLANLSPPHLGPPIPEVSSIWFKLYLYQLTKSGPPSLLLAKGSRIRSLPKIFESCSRLLVTSWGHDPSEIPVTGALNMLLDALQHSPILVQAITTGSDASAKTKHLPFPKDKQNKEDLWATLPDLVKLQEMVDLEHTCGYVTLLDLNLPGSGNTQASSNETDPENGKVADENADLLLKEVESVSAADESKGDRKKKMSLNLSGQREHWILLDLNFGIPLFDSELNQKICANIAENGLWRKHSLEALSQGNQSMCDNLLEFISSHQRSYTNHIKMGHEDDHSLPTQNLFFDGRILKLWRGR